MNPLTNPKRAPFTNWHEVGWLRNKKVTFEFHFEANRRGALFECMIEEQGKSNGLWELRHSPDGHHYLLTDIRNPIIEHNLSVYSYFESIKTELLGCCELLAT